MSNGEGPSSMPAGAKTPGLLGVALALACAGVGAALIWRAQDKDPPGHCNEAKLAALPSIGASRLAAGLGFTFVLDGGRILKRDSRGRSVPLAIAAEPLEKALLYAEEPTTQRVLVALRDRKTCGWVEREHLLLRPGARLEEYADGPRPLKLADLPARANALEPGRAESAAGYLRALPNWGLPRLREGLRVYREAGGLGIRSLPSEKALKPYHVFAYRPAGGSSWAAGQGHFLIGARTDATHILGWVMAADVTIWGSGLAGVWAGTGEGRGYPDLASLRGALNPLVREPRRRQLRSAALASPFPVLARGIDADSQRADRSASGHHLATTHPIWQPFRDPQSGPAAGTGVSETTRHLVYISEVTRGGLPVLDLYLALEPADIDRVLHVYGVLCQNMGRADAARYVRSVAEVLLAPDGTRSTSLAGLFSQSMNIPVTYLPELMSQPWDDMSEKLRLEAPIDHERLKKKLCQAFQKIEAVKVGRRGVAGAALQAASTSSATGGTAAGHDSFDWRVGSGDTLILYLLPISYLNP